MLQLFICMCCMYIYIYIYVYIIICFQGDSGGPLFCKRDGVYFQAGVVSYGEKCGDPSAVGIYTKVAKYIEWINSVVTSNK